MKAVLAPILVALLSSGAVFAAPPQPSLEPSAVNAIKQLEQDMGDAMMRVDLPRLREIYADDFAAFGGAGKVITKQDVISDFGSLHDRLKWFENGPMDVQVFGDIAMAHGSVKEIRVKNGKDTSGAFAWMDLLERRGGKWAVARSAGAKVALAADQPNSSSQDAVEIEAINRVEQELGDAMVAVDLEKIGQAFADDWAGIGSAGKRVAKAQVLEDFKSGHRKLLSFELAPMTVRVLGNVALVQGAANEQRAQDGKETSGNFVFMDLVEKRSGQWVIVRTMGARLE
jgi:ketosteroid isomerase-like protein